MLCFLSHKLVLCFILSKRIRFFEDRGLLWNCVICFLFQFYFCILEKLQLRDFLKLFSPIIIGYVYQLILEVSIEKHDEERRSVEERQHLLTLWAPTKRWRWYTVIATWSTTNGFLVQTTKNADGYKFESF